MSDLIERMKGPFNYAPRKKGEPHYLKVPEKLIEECITALSPVLPDDVAEVISTLNPYGKQKAAIDMLERQAREKHELQDTAKIAFARNKELQQRIEELTADGGIPNCAVPKHELRQVITALSPVLPDDVAEMVKALAHQAALLPACCYGSAADMLERQAGEIGQLEEQIRGQCEIEMNMAAEILELVTTLAALKESREELEAALNIAITNAKKIEQIASHALAERNK